MHHDFGPQPQTPRTNENDTNTLRIHHVIVISYRCSKKKFRRSPKNHVRRFFFCAPLDSTSGSQTSAIFSSMSGTGGFTMLNSPLARRSTDTRPSVCDRRVAHNTWTVLPFSNMVFAGAPQIVTSNAKPEPSSQSSLAVMTVLLLEVGRTGVAECRTPMKKMAVLGVDVVT